MSNVFLINFSQIPEERQAEADACGERTRLGWLVDMDSDCFLSLVPHDNPIPPKFLPDLPMRRGKTTSKPEKRDFRQLTEEEQDARELALAIADPKGLGDRVAQLIHKTGLDRVNKAYNRYMGNIEGCKCNARRKKLNRVGQIISDFIKGKKKDQQ